MTSWLIFTEKQSTLQAKTNCFPMSKIAFFVLFYKSTTNKWQVFARKKTAFSETWTKKTSKQTNYFFVSSVCPFIIIRAFCLFFFRWARMMCFDWNRKSSIEPLLYSSDFELKKNKRIVVFCCQFFSQPFCLQMIVFF